MTRFLFERRFGIRTSGNVDLESLGVAGDDRWHYEPAEWRVLSRVLKQRDVGPEDVFLDFGSGMGRVVLRAAQYGPKRVIGVELSDDLNAIARENVDRMRHRLKCQDIELVTADALEYEVPGDATIVFFNNPFTGPTFSEVMQRLVSSLDQSPRRMRIIYRNPIEHEAVIATNRFQLIDEWQRSGRRGRPASVRIHLYESIADGSKAADGTPASA